MICKLSLSVIVIGVVALLGWRVVAQTRTERNTGLPAERNIAPGNANEAFVCYRQGNATRVIPAEHSNVSFAANVNLELELHGDKIEFSQEQLSTIAKHAARAMVLWRSACTHCTGGNVTVITINKTRYVDSLLARYLRSADLNNIVDVPTHTQPSAEELEKWRHTIPHFAVGQSTGSPTPQVPPPANPTMTQPYVYPYSIFLSMLSQHQTPSSVLTDYEVVGDEDLAFKHFCSADENKLPQMLREARSSFKCSDSAGKGSSTASQLRVYALDRFTSCGRNANIIGCSADDLVVELNARDYRFVAHDTGNVVFGMGGPKVDLLHVLLHETGHWMGLPHLAEEGNIMADSVQKSRCIDDTDVSELDHHVLDEKARMQGKGAFFYSKPDTELTSQ